MRVFVILFAGVLLTTYVQTMVFPGISIIEKDLSTTATVGSWIASIVLLVGAAVSPIMGKLGDLYGKKKLLIAALAFYTVGNILAGFSTSIYLLLFARAIQGIGLTVLPLSLALITDIFPKEKVTMAQGALGGAAAISMALGLLLGAYSIQDLGWQVSFQIVAVISVIVLVAIIAGLKRDISCTKCRIDYLGALLLGLGVALLLVFATEGSTLGWFSGGEIALLVSGLALTVLFFYVESKIDEPLIPLKLLKIRNVLVSNLITLIAGLATNLLFFVVIAYAELPKPLGLGFDIIAIGLMLLPGTIVMLLLGPILGRIIIKTGPKPILAGGGFLLILSFALLILNRGTGTAVTVGVIFGFAGIISLLAPVANIISLSLPTEDGSVGQAFNLTLRNIGGAIGPILATAVLAVYTTPLTQIIAGNPVVVATVPSATGFNVVLAAGIALGVAVIVISLATKNAAFKSKSLVGETTPQIITNKNEPKVVKIKKPETKEVTHEKIDYLGH
ncbi:MAG: MFS transporter [Candidatus Bathyarchaeia archaeon]